MLEWGACKLIKFVYARCSCGPKCQNHYGSNILLLWPPSMLSLGLSSVVLGAALLPSFLNPN